MPKTVGVAVSNATFHFDKLYTYAVMPDQQNAVKLGSMVLVPFGRGSRARMGVVLACDAEPESAKLKYLFDVAPASACLTPELLRLVHFLKERTFCTYYEAVKAVIPYGAQYKPAVAADGVTPVLQKQLTRHTENSYRLVGGLPPKPKPTAKQLAAVALLGGGPRTLNELEDKGISRAVLDNLCAKGVLECSKVNKSIDLYSSIPLKNEPITLTQEQQAAYDALLPKLEDAIRRNLDAGKQTILLLNRRGYQTMAQCEDCREVLKCTKCSVPMVYHKAAHKVLCHYCGSQMEPPTVCPACGGKLQYRGFGTQKAEEELAKLFPDARVLRMDQDSTAAKDAHEKLLARFANHEYDIMVGTQMVAKGLDFEDVTLVGVLGIDSLLFAQGFRAYENVFSLITQVVGRSGRARDPGFAIIQTTDPDNPVLNLAAAQDYDAFFEQEIAYRKLGLYPPFCGLCVIGFAGAKEIEVARAAARFAALLGQQAAKQPDLPLRVLGPTPGSIEKINDTYRYKLTIKCRNDRRFRDLVRSTLERYEQEKLPSKATVAVDLHSDGDI